MGHANWEMWAWLIAVTVPKLVTNDVFFRIISKFSKWFRKCQDFPQTVVWKML